MTDSFTTDPTAVEATVQPMFPGFAFPADPTHAAILGFLFSTPGELLHMSIYYILNPVMMTVAICTNIINTIVFIRGRIKDTMALVFLGLAFSDLIYNILSLTSRLFTALHVVFNLQPYLNFYKLSFILLKNSRLWLTLSTLLTIFAAAQKCACIAIPLHFRNYFTRKKTITGVILIYAAVFAFFMPFLCLDVLEPYYDPFTNRTRLGQGYREPALALALYEIVRFVTRVLLPFISQGIVVFCVIVMTVKLRAAAKTRLGMTSGASKREVTSEIDSKPTGTATDSTKNEIGSDSDTKPNPARQKSRTDKQGSVKDKDVLSSKELRVIRSVNIVCAIFVAGMAPATLIEAVAAFVPTFGGGSERVLAPLYFSIDGVRQLIMVSSTAVNILVYYNYNNKYKEAFNTHILRRASKEKS